MDKQYIKSLLNKLDPVVFEIGCNDGSDTQEFIDVFEDITMYCFEPDKRAYNKFKNNITYEKCYLYNVAVSDVDGECDFYISDSNQNNPGTPKVVGNNWDKSGSIKNQNIIQFYILGVNLMK